MTKVAILGLGIMGGGMAGRLLEKGYDLTVWNRSPARTLPWAEKGARVAATPADAARGADVVIAMVADDAASEACWLGDDGALSAMAAGAIAIESSTVTPDWIKRLGAAASSQGVGLLDAPVSGSKVQAATGALRFLVGGDAADLDRARPLFDILGGSVLACGPLGSGALVKLLNNYMCGVQVASLAEALAMAERSGLDIETTATVLTEGAPGSPMVKMLARRMIDHDLTPNFMPTLMAKDLGYAFAALDGAGIESALAQAARARFVDAIDQGLGEADIAAVLEPLRAQVKD